MSADDGLTESERERHACCLEDLRAALPTDAAEALARVRAEAKAEALREAADALDEYADPFPGEEAAWLRDRADQIARTTDPEERP